MKKVNRSMEEAILTEAEQLRARRVPLELAAAIYREMDLRYRDCLEKGNSAQAYLYIAREGCALYMRETLGVDIG